MSSMDLVELAIITCHRKKNNSFLMTFIPAPDEYCSLALGFLQIASSCPLLEESINDK